MNTPADLHTLRPDARDVADLVTRLLADYGEQVLALVRGEEPAVLADDPV